MHPNTKLDSIQYQVDDVAGIMHENIDNTMRNTENIGILEGKVDDLKGTTINEGTWRVERKPGWRKKLKMRLSKCSKKNCKRLCAISGISSVLGTPLTLGGSLVGLIPTFLLARHVHRMNPRSNYQRIP